MESCITRFRWDFGKTIFLRSYLEKLVIGNVFFPITGSFCLATADLASIIVTKEYLGKKIDYCSLVRVFIFYG